VIRKLRVSCLPDKTLNFDKNPQNKVFFLLLRGQFACDVNVTGEFSDYHRMHHLTHPEKRQIIRGVNEIFDPNHADAARTRKIFVYDTAISRKLM
jgi:hypothetical protein